MYSDKSKFSKGKSTKHLNLFTELLKRFKVIINKSGKLQNNTCFLATYFSLFLHYKVYYHRLTLQLKYNY